MQITIILSEWIIFVSSKEEKKENGKKGINELTGVSRKTTIFTAVQYCSNYETQHCQIDPIKSVFEALLITVPCTLLGEKLLWWIQGYDEFKSMMNSRTFLISHSAYNPLLTNKVAAYFNWVQWVCDTGFFTNY